MAFNFDFASCCVQFTAEKIVIEIAGEPSRRVTFVSGSPSDRKIVTTSDNLRLYIETSCKCEMRILDVKGHGLVQFRSAGCHSLSVKDDDMLDSKESGKLGVVVYHNHLSDSGVDLKTKGGRIMEDSELVQHSAKWSKQLLKKHDDDSDDDKPFKGWARLDDLAGAKILGEVFWEHWDEADEPMFEGHDALYMGKKSSRAH